MQPHGCVSIGSKIYAIGGLHDKLETNSNQSHVQVYDATTRTWSLAAPLPIPLGHIQPGTCLAGDKIVVVGGHLNTPDGRNLYSKQVFEYDPARNHWSTLPSLPEPRLSIFAGFVNGKLIVNGGNTSYPPYLSSATWLGY